MDYPLTEQAEQNRPVFGKTLIITLLQYEYDESKLL